MHPTRNLYALILRGVLALLLEGWRRKGRGQETGRQREGQRMPEAKDWGTPRGEEWRRCQDPASGVYQGQQAGSVQCLAHVSSSFEVCAVLVQCCMQLHRHGSAEAHSGTAWHVNTCLE